MCSPTAAVGVASLVIGATSSYVQYEQQSNYADMQNERYRENQQNSLQAMRDQQQAVQQRILQENEASAQQVQDRQRQARRDRATARVSAGEAGTTGISVENIMRDISNVSSQDITNIHQNRDWSNQQLSSQLAGTRTTAQSRINSASRASSPSPVSLGLGIGQAALNSYSVYNRLNS